MAFTYGFYNYNENDADQKLYDAEQMSQLFDGIITDGVYAHVGSCFLVSAIGSGSNSVIIGSGRAWFNHTWSYNDRNYILEAPPAPTTQYRIDAVVIDINSNKNSRTNKFDWRMGSESSNPTRPTLIHEEKHNQYALAYVMRTPGVTAIRAADISNAVGTNETPYVTGVLESISASQILSDFTAQFNSFITSSTNRVTDLLTEWENIYGGFIANCDNRFQGTIHEYEAQVDSIISRMANDFNSFLSQKTSEFNSFLNTKTSEFESFISTKDYDFNGFVNTKAGEFSAFMEDCQSQVDNFLTSLEALCNEKIKKYALVAEGYAAGTQDGTPSSIMPYYHNNAKYYSQQAAASADVATTKASEATTSATNAASSASTASTKASEASTSATNASNSASTAITKANEAATSASTASTKASEAATSATTATDKASESVESASIATTKANEASESASTATAKASEATTSAETALTKANEASISEMNAANSASTALTKANEAAISAESAFDSAEKAEDAKRYVYDALGIPEFYVDFVTGLLMYTKQSEYSFAIDPSSGQLTYEPL